MVGDYLSILMLFIFALLLTGTFVALSAIIGRKKNSKTNLEPYECGIDQAQLPRRPLSVKFFAVAIAFLLFDVEVALLYPWADLFRTFVVDGMGKFIMIEGLVFIAVLAVGLVYIYRVGILDWEK